MHTNEQALSLLSILPLVGQFHVDYSAAIDSIQLFRFVHEEVGKHVFGKEAQAFPLVSSCYNPSWWLASCKR